MKRLLITLFMLGLLIAACGSPDEVEPSSADLDPAESAAAEADSIETKVAATVAAALGQSAPAEPTEPAISGNATPLTPIPQLREDMTIEVSPEVGYAEPGEDGVVVFDFGGGTEEATNAATTGGLIPLGGTATGTQGLYAITLRDAQFIESYSGAQQNIEPEAGFRLLRLQYEIVNLGPRAGLSEVLYGFQIMDRDDDVFYCSGFYADQQSRQREVVLPGYGEAYEAVCQIPVTAAAEEMVGLRAVLGPNSGVDPTFDLGDRSGIATDFSPLRAGAVTALPISSADFCPENTDLPYRLEAARWYDAPDAQPPDDVLAAAVAWSRDASAASYYYSDLPAMQLQRLSAVETPEERRTIATQLWQEVWAPYDLTGMDVVALDIVTTNQGKQANVSPIEAQSFASFDSTNPLSPFKFADYGANQAYFNSLLLPFTYLSPMMPPGGEQRTTLYGVVAETAATFDLVHLYDCASVREHIILQLPRQTLTPNTGPATVSSEPVIVPENLQHMVDAGATQVEVPAGQERTYTGIMVAENQQITFGYVGGLWRGGPAAEWPMIDANGDQRVCRKATFSYPDGCLMELVWGVGDSEAIGSIGTSGLSSRSPLGGELWFGPNDDNFSDNAGSLVILVQLH